MQHPDKIALVKKAAWLPAFFLLGLALLSFIGCCGGYSYEKYKSKAEYELSIKNYKKVSELYSMIFNHETQQDPVDMEKVTWAFYRLGVIAEVTGDLRMALGYYWGDKIDEGYYQDFARLSWLAQQGWDWLDAGNPPRTIEKIIDLEENGRLPKVPTGERRKKEVVVTREQERFEPPSTRNKSNRPRASFKRSLTPPPPNAQGPFKVFH